MIDTRNTVPIVFGWDGLADYLTGLGLLRSASALQSARRRHGLPVQGGGIPGRPVAFSRTDISIWVRFFTGVELDVWMYQQEKDRKGGVASQLEAAHPEKATPEVLDFVLASLIAVTAPLPMRGEGVHRLPGGLVLATTKPDVASEWGITDDLPPMSEIYRYASCRMAKPGDLRPRVKPNRRAKTATSLLVAVEMDGNSAKFLRVPGHHFGLKEGTVTALIVSVNDPMRDEVIKAGMAENPEAAWFVWSKRRKTRLITLDEPPPRNPWDEIMDDVCE